MARFWSLSLLISALIIIDQLIKGAIQSSFSYGETKVIIEGFFSLAYVKNTGAAFGFGADGHILFRQVLFLALPVVFCAWVFYMLVKTLKGPFYMSLAYALILAGATGNLIDRFTLGYVVDFLMFYWKDESHHFPAFNVADSCITVAGFLLVLDFFIQLKHKKKRKMLPILFQTNGIIFYSYPLLMGLGWGAAYQIFLELLPPSLPKSRALILFWGIFVFSWIGAKVLFLTTIPYHLSSTLVQESSFWIGGGFVFYGGFLGTVVYLLILKGLKFPLNKDILWPMLPALAFGHAIGRFGCFLAGCCCGKETDFFWGIHLHGALRHPTQLIECFSLLVLGFYLLRSKRSRIELISFYFVSYGFLRMIVESLRGDLIRGQWGFLTPSQWISVALIIAGSAVYLRKDAFQKQLN